MKWRLVILALCGALLLGGCWDRVEVEDQLFVVILGVDQGQQRRFRVTAYVPIPALLKAGVLGGQGKANQSSGLLTAEADTVAQAVYVLNASVTRRITMRQVRLIVVGEEMARRGLNDFYAEMLRNHEMRETVAFVVARGEAHAVLRTARFTGESNAARIGEGLLLVEKHLHLSPPIRLHHMTNRTSSIGIDPFAAVAAVNQQLTGGGTTALPQSAIAGELARYTGNPIEIAGTALFQDTRLVGFLTVDETQALLAMRGEMGKAYVTLPNPMDPTERLLLRFGQENKPKSQTAITRNGPRVSIRLLLEAEVISGDENYRDPAVRQKVEAAARDHMETQMRSVLVKMQQWQTDPVGFGLLFRGKFRTFDDWKRYDWRQKLSQLKVDVKADMRIRRAGLTLGTEGSFAPEQ